MPDMPEVPEGRCMVCRAAWEPCRSCRGKVLHAKCVETMKRNGTVPTYKKRGGEIKFMRDPEQFPQKATPRNGGGDA